MGTATQARDRAQDAATATKWTKANALKKNPNAQRTNSQHKLNREAVTTTPPQCLGAKGRAFTKWPSATAGRKKESAMRIQITCTTAARLHATCVLEHNRNVCRRVSWQHLLITPLLLLIISLEICILFLLMHGMRFYYEDDLFDSKRCCNEHVNKQFIIKSHNLRTRVKRNLDLFDFFWF